MFSFVVNYDLVPLDRSLHKTTPSQRAKEGKLNTPDLKIQTRFKVWEEMHNLISLYSGYKVYTP